MPFDEMREDEDHWNMLVAITSDLRCGSLMNMGFQSNEKPSKFINESGCLFSLLQLRYFVTQNLKFAKRLNVMSRINKYKFSIPIVSFKISMYCLECLMDSSLGELLL